ncbi:hypothetical protein [Kutzneria sp. NPDC052558]|uniref:hypothetical protein n=1 Tax=Kutzneria sp. NPDC052558 TaxID=3364121 RepID=UPI0037C76067
MSKRVRLTAAATLFAGVATAVLTLSSGAASAAPAPTSASSVTTAPSHLITPNLCKGRLCI